MNDTDDDVTECEVMCMEVGISCRVRPCPDSGIVERVLVCLHQRRVTRVQVGRFASSSAGLDAYPFTRGSVGVSADAETGMPSSAHRGVLGGEVTGVVARTVSRRTRCLATGFSGHVVDGRSGSECASLKVYVPTRQQVGLLGRGRGDQGEGGHGDRPVGLPSRQGACPRICVMLCRRADECSSELPDRRTGLLAHRCETKWAGSLISSSEGRSVSRPAGWRAGLPRHSEGGCTASRVASGAARVVYGEQGHEAAGWSADRPENV